MRALVPITGDPENPVKSKRLSFDQIKEWNDFMDKNGDGSDLFNLYAKYKKLNPKGKIDYDALNNEMNLLTRNNQRMASNHSGEIKQVNLNTANRFPVMKTGDGNVLGPVNGDITTQNSLPPRKMPDYMINKEVPDYITKLEWDHSWNMPYYLDGDEIKYVDRKFYNQDRFLKNQPTGISGGLVVK